MSETPLNLERSDDVTSIDADEFEVRWRWRCLWCGATARWRRDLCHTGDCAVLPSRRIEKPERVG
jgi:hypothetical protein